MDKSISKSKSSKKTIASKKIKLRETPKSVSKVSSKKIEIDDTGETFAKKLKEKLFKSAKKVVVSKIEKEPITSEEDLKHLLTKRKKSTTIVREKPKLKVVVEKVVLDESQVKDEGQAIIERNLQSEKNSEQKEKFENLTEKFVSSKKHSTSSKKIEEIEKVGGRKSIISEVEMSRRSSKVSNSNTTSARRSRSRRRKSRNKTSIKSKK